MRDLSITTILQDQPQLIEAIKLPLIHNILINLLHRQRINRHLTYQSNCHLRVVPDLRDEVVQSVHGLQIQMR